MATNNTGQEDTQRAIDERLSRVGHVLLVLVLWMLFGRWDVLRQLLRIRLLPLGSEWFHINKLLQYYLKQASCM